MFLLTLFGIIFTLGGLGITALYAVCRINGSPVPEVWFFLVGGLGGLVVGVVLLVIAVTLKRKRQVKPADAVVESPKPKEPTIYEKHIKAAQSGDAEAQIVIGNCYYSGKGVKKNYAEAVRWYTKASEQGNSLATNYLGKCYQCGYGVEKNDKTAVGYYKQAAAMHEPNALCNLAQCHLDGRGTTKNYKRAFELASEAADKGFARAQCMLGLMFEEGKGVKRSKERAVEWYQKAVEQDSADGMFYLGRAYLNATTNMMFRNHTVHTDGEKLWIQAAEKGHKEAQYQLGMYYYNEMSIPLYYSGCLRVVKWLSLAKKNGYPCDKVLDTCQSFIKRRKAQLDAEMAKERAEQERKERIQRAKDEAAARRYAERMFPDSKPSASSSASSSPSSSSCDSSYAAPAPKVDPDADTLYHTDTKIIVRYNNEHEGAFGLKVYDADVDATFYYASKSGHTATRSTGLCIPNVQYNSVSVSDVEYRCPSYTGKY